MSNPSLQPLEELRQRIQLLERGRPPLQTTVLPFDCPSLDKHLPQGGLALGALHEISAAPGIYNEAAATLFVAGILARMSGSILWCVKAHDLFAPGLACAGLTTERIIYAEARDEKSLLIVMEEGLRHNALCAVVGEISRLSTVASRRLHLAARSSGITAFALYRQSQFVKKQTQEPTASVSRWRITALPSHSFSSQEIGRSRWQIELTRCRDTENAFWIMEACDATGTLSLPPDMAHRQIADETRSAIA